MCTFTRPRRCGSSHQNPGEDTELCFGTETFTRIHKAPTLFTCVFLESPFPAERGAAALSPGPASPLAVLPQAGTPLI